MIYRPEIDGLRALAVLPVLLFHARTPGFHGGFIGVDVFFVISGYLITAIILQDLNKGAFSLGQFYERRARRILPALYFVILCSIPMVWIVAMPSQLKDFSQSLVAISAIAANIFFYLKIGYFEPATELNPLLHVWSLAVEEQFYFIFPIFLILSFRWLRQGIVPLILLLSIASFMIAQSLLATDPSQSFFLPFGRAWELMIGALLNFLPKRTKSWKLGWEIGATLGLSMIVGSIFILNETHPFPGLLALPPTFGTALVIYCTSSSFGIGKLLANRLAVGIGLVSYSTYLWHQPLFAIARIHVLGDPPLFVFLILSLLSIGLAYLTWRYIERPFRNKKVIPRKTLVIACVAAIAPVVALGISGHMTDGFKEIKYKHAGKLFQDFERRLQKLTKERNGVWNDTIKSASLNFSSSNSTRKVMVVGDSRAEDLFVSLLLNEDLFMNTEFRYQRLDEPCFPALHSPNALSLGACGTEAKEFIERMKDDRADLVLISCGWLTGVEEQLKMILGYLKDTPCLVFGSASFNRIDSLFFAISRRDLPKDEWPNFFTQNVHTRSRDASLRIKQLAETHNFLFIDTYELFQINSDRNTSEVVYNLVTEDGDPLLIDQTHLTVEGAYRFGKMISQKGWIGLEY